jgi:D-glycero-beta-D-manno-heptose 1-phosphate adenylyltransferase
VIEWSFECGALEPDSGIGEHELGQVVSQNELILRVAQEKRNGRRIVFTNGCFDLLHAGHIECLEKAHIFGDILIVGVNSDSSVRGLKGEDRPLVPQEDRARVVAALATVDYVTIFDEPTPHKLIAAILPHVLAKGGDWALDQIVGREEVETAGGRVVSIPVAPGYSTTKLIERIRNAGKRQVSG